MRTDQVLLSLVSGAFLTVLASATPPPPPPSRTSETGAPQVAVQAVALSNAYGDSVWFDSDTIRVGARYSLGPHDASGTQGPPEMFVPAGAKSAGTPIALVLGCLEPRENARDVLTHWLELPPRQRTQRGLRASRESTATGSEPGVLGPRGKPSGFGWDFSCPASETGSARIVFIVVGTPDTTLASSDLRQPWQEAWGRSRTSADPIPLRTDRWHRIYDLSDQDIRRTARIVGDVCVDFDRRRVTVYDEAGAPVK